MRRLFMLATVVVLSAGFIVASSGIASAAKVIDNVGAPDGVSCAPVGGSLNFKVPIGNGGSYVVPTKNKGNKITISGVSVHNCVDYGQVSGTFSGTISGKITITNPSQNPAAFYSCANLQGPIPSAGGTLKGTLKIKWSPPPGQTFSPKDSIVTFSDAFGQTTTQGGVTYAQFAVPYTTPLGVTGAFPGADGGASSSFNASSANGLGSILAQCGTAGGVSSLMLSPSLLGGLFLN